MKERLLDPFFWLAVPLSLAAACIVPIWLSRSRIVVTRLRATSVSLVVLGIIATACWSWFFRDGLGPGFMPTAGPRAFVRFLEGFVVPLVIASAEILIIDTISKRRVTALQESARVPK